LNNEPDNQSQLVSDLQEYYFNMKPILKVDTLKRLLLGQMKKDGLFAHLQRCHEDTSNIKTRTLIYLMKKLMDHTMCHQVNEIEAIWRSQPANYIQACQFE